MHDRNQSIMRDAYFMATHSHDPSTQNGAILVPCQSQLPCVGGWNHLPAGSPCEWLEDREKKYAAIIHAEEHVLLRAATMGVPTEGATLVCPWACCVKCAAQMVECGIRKLIVHVPAMERDPHGWADSILAGHSLLTANNIAVEFLDDLGGLARSTVLYRGEPR